MTDTLETLNERLAGLNTQMEQVQQLMALDASDASLKELMQDLESAIALTRDALRLKQLETEAKNTMFKPGEYVYGLYQGLWYTGIVTGTVPLDNNTTEYIVSYVGYGNTDVVSVEKNTIKPYADPPLQYLLPGTKVLAIYDADKQFYEAGVDNLTEDKTALFVYVQCIVLICFNRTFLGYGGLQETPLKHVRLINHHGFYAPVSIVPAATTIPVSSNNDQAPAATTRHEKAKQEQQKLQKNKKKKEKKEAKFKEIDKDRLEKQQKWQSFMSSNKKLGQKSVTSKPEEVHNNYIPNRPGSSRR